MNKYIPLAQRELIAFIRPDFGLGFRLLSVMLLFAFSYTDPLIAIHNIVLVSAFWLLGRKPNIDKFTFKIPQSYGFGLLYLSAGYLALLIFNMEDSLAAANATSNYVKSILSIWILTFGFMIIGAIGEQARKMMKHEEDLGDSVLKHSVGYFLAAPIITGILIGIFMLAYSVFFSTGIGGFSKH